MFTRNFGVADLAGEGLGDKGQIVRPLPSEAKLRIRVSGKFIFLGDRKFHVRGVTYGTFRPDADGNEFPPAAVVDNDFRQMSAAGLNAVRTYTPPPRWLLDAAEWHGLRVMVGLAGERSSAFLDYQKCVREIEDTMREKVAGCAGHPAVLCYSVANEIPASLVRWHGHRKVEQFIERLSLAVKAEDPGGLVTYANYPSTEYLQLPFLDLVCFNVYLESQARLEAYLARLHTLAEEVWLDKLLIALGIRDRRKHTRSRNGSCKYSV